MTQQEWEAATLQEQQAEMERCKDQRYFYNNYIKGNNTKPYSQEAWDEHIRTAELRRIGGRQSIKHLEAHLYEKTRDEIFGVPLAPLECKEDLTNFEDVK